jgi:hypothetical protein
MNKLQIEFTMVADALPEFTEKSKYGDYTKPLLCLHSDGHLETCVLREYVDSEHYFPQVHWHYSETPHMLCQDVIGWTEFEVIGGEG